MNRTLIAALLAGAALLPAAGHAQQLEGPPPGTPKQVAPLTHTNLPALRMVEGQPIETDATELPNDKPLFPEQTRAPYHKTAPYKTTVITDKLHLPWCVAFLPDGKYLVTEKDPAAIRIVDKDGTISAPLKGLTPLAAPGKLGVLEVALDPHFKKNHKVYFTFYENHAEGRSNTFVAHAILNEAAETLDDVTVIFRSVPVILATNFSTKQGGRIVFDPKGNLIVEMGDRDLNTPWRVAQQLDNDLGKVIRITPEGLPAPGNPFIGKQGALPEIWAYGFRSPEGLAVDPRTGHVWETEHGPRGGDELNMVSPGKNYGWPVITHGIDYPGVLIGDGITAKEGMEQPVYYWDPVIAPSGLDFYKGNLFPEWKHSLLAGALRRQMVDRLEIRGDKVVAEEPLLTELHARIRDVRSGPDGAVYVLTEKDTLLKLTPK